MKRVGILVVAYNAAATLHTVLDRIPADVRVRIDQVLISDDASADATYLIGLGYSQLEPDLSLTVIRQERNLGYGGNQKAGYRWAIDHDLDIIVLLHGDGQYAPEILADMIAPLENDECDAVFGSRILDQGAARRGGMPLYKYVGNRILTTFENKVMGTSLSEWHSGYRAYSVQTLREIPFERNSDGFEFDTEIIVQLIEARKEIREIPIPTYYGDEISHVNGIRYAYDICRHVVRYRLQKMGFGSGDLTFASETYEDKAGDESSHAVVVRLLRNRSPRRILDIGCGDGRIGERLRLAGHAVTGVDAREEIGVRERLDAFYKADLDEGIPPEAGENFDVVVAADVLEHLPQPERALLQIRDVMNPSGTLIASVPNVAHWYPRVRFASGRFDYDRRGILDRGHVRFFTRRTFERMARNCGYRVVSAMPTGLPIDVVDRGTDAEPGRLRAVVRHADAASLAIWPNLFAYQWVFELQPM